MNNDASSIFSSFDTMNVGIAVYKLNICENKDCSHELVYKNGSFNNEMQLEIGEYYLECDKNYVKLNLNEVLIQFKVKVMVENKPHKLYKKVYHNEKYYLIIASKLMNKYIQLTVIENSHNIISIENPHNIINIENSRRFEEVRALAFIVESSNDAIIGMSLDAIISSFNTGAENIYGYKKHEVIGKHISMLAFEHSNDEINNILYKIKNGIKVVNYEALRKKKNGESVTVSITASPIFDSNNNIIGASTIARDITEMKLNEIQKTSTDELTGLYNRRYINERLAIDINNSNINGQSLSIIMADIDCLKNVNDKYGHVVGDRIIRDFSKRLKNTIRMDMDWVGRYGSDEFLIVLNNTELENAYRVAERVRKRIAGTLFGYEDINIKVTSSFGVYCTKNGKSDIENILTEVDKNLHEAKKKGGNRTIIDNDIKMNEIQLSILNKEIQDLRESLNEVCVTTDETVSSEQRLNMSELLDKLIVEYMKNIEYK